MAKDKKKAIDAEINKTLLDDFDRFDGLVHRRWKEMLYCAVGIVVIVGVVYSIMLNIEKKKEIAFNTLTSATSEADILAAIEKFGNYPATDAARLRLANIYLADAKYDEAAAQMSKIITSNVSQEFKNRVALDRGYIIEKSGKLSEASAIYLQIANNNMNDNEVRMEAFYGAARLAIENQELDSATTYLSSVDNLSKNLVNQESLWATLAKNLLASIK